jgi:hypothetical protein
MPVLGQCLKPADYVDVCAPTHCHAVPFCVAGRGKEGLEFLLRLLPFQFRA